MTSIFEKKTLKKAILFSVCALALASCKPAKVGELPAPSAKASEITIETDPAGASVSIDGVLLGPSPQKAKLNPGPHTVSVRKSGYFSKDSRVSVTSNSPRTLAIPLVASH